MVPPHGTAEVTASIRQRIMNGGNRYIQTLVADSEKNGDVDKTMQGRLRRTRPRSVRSDKSKRSRNKDTCVDADDLVETPQQINDCGNVVSIGLNPSSSLLA